MKDVKVIINGGLEVLCEPTIVRGDKSVGDRDWIIEDYRLFWLTGHECPDSVYERLMRCPDGIADFYNQLYDMIDRGELP